MARARVPSLYLPTPGTHRVVSWLMLVKEELLKELILLLLKSLEETKASLLRGKERNPSNPCNPQLSARGSSPPLLPSLRWQLGGGAAGREGPSACSPRSACIPRLPVSTTPAPPCRPSLGREGLASAHLHNGNAPTRERGCLQTSRPSGSSVLPLPLARSTGSFPSPPTTQGARRWWPPSFKLGARSQRDEVTHPRSQLIPLFSNLLPLCLSFLRSLIGTHTHTPWLCLSVPWRSFFSSQPHLTDPLASVHSGRLGDAPGSPPHGRRQCPPCGPSSPRL